MDMTNLLHCIETDVIKMWLCQLYAGRDLRCHEQCISLTKIVQCAAPC